MKPGKPMKKLRDRREALRALPFGNENTRKALFQSSAGGLEDSWLGYNKKRAAQAGPFQVCFEILS
jgi:hypothetical protein